MRALGTAQHHLTSFQGEYRAMTSERNERGFNAVDFTLFSFFPGYGAIQSTVYTHPVLSPIELSTVYFGHYSAYMKYI